MYAYFVLMSPHGTHTTVYSELPRIMVEHPLATVVASFDTYEAMEDYCLCHGVYEPTPIRCNYIAFMAAAQPYYQCQSYAYYGRACLMESLLLHHGQHSVQALYFPARHD